METYDFYRVAPKDAVLVTTHLEIVDSSRRNEVESSLALVERATQRLSQAGTDLILMNGLPLLLFGGIEGHQHILGLMRRVAGVPITTAAQALVNAFCHLGSKRILMISSWRPASRELLENLKRFLFAGGIEVGAVEGLGGEFGSHEKYQISSADLHQRVLSVARNYQDYDAIFIQSGTLATMEILDPLEQEIGVPVVSSNCANTWALFKPLGIKANSGYGKLLSSL